jgi:tetratricopeptide (TPR) repeat protein
MAVKTEKDLTDNARSLWLKAASAMELRNFGYAITLLQAVLKEAPEFLEARKWLRKAEIASTKGKKNFFSGLSAASLKGGSLVKKDPRAAMELAEKALETDPYSPQANNLLKDAAIAAELPEIARFALETLIEANPKDTKVLHELARHFYDREESEKAVEIYNKIVEINPNDLVAIKLGKDASARASMKKGGWDEVAESGGKKDYRDLIQDKDAAVSREQQNRVVKSVEVIDQQLVELYAQAEQSPDSVDLARKIASLFEQKDEIDNALWWYHRGLELTKNTDPGIARKISDLQLRQKEEAIASRGEFLSTYPDHEQASQYRQELADLIKEKAEMLIGEARKRVERNPTDLQFRYELGEQLVLAGHFTEAIPELQKARQNPNARIKAMSLLGECYTGKSMLDFAIRQYHEAIKELSVMDNTKKHVLYKLGLVYEKLGDKEKSLDCMKQIYEVDYGYEDVAPRVEGSYGSAA